MPVSAQSVSLRTLHGYINRRGDKPSRIKVVECFMFTYTPPTHPRHETGFKRRFMDLERLVVFYLANSEMQHILVCQVFGPLMTAYSQLLSCRVKTDADVAGRE